jgi:hypothetical protein
MQNCLHALYKGGKENTQLENLETKRKKEQLNKRWAIHEKKGRRRVRSRS